MTPQGGSAVDRINGSAVDVYAYLRSRAWTRVSNLHVDAYTHQTCAHVNAFVKLSLFADDVSVCAWELASIHRRDVHVSCVCHD